MPDKNYKVYPYRWVILGVFMLINLVIQILWICFAPITGPVAQFYGVSDLQIGFLAMSFMIVYIPISIPVSWIVDTIGYRKSVSIGAVMMAVFAMLRGVFASSYALVFISTIGLAVSQPFMMNSISTVAAKWFPIKERATASGMVIVASFLGIAVGEVASPLLFLKYGIATMLLSYGITAALSAFIFIIFTREAPPTPPCSPGDEARALVLKGLKSMLKMKDIWILMVLFLVGMGVFNGISTWIEGIMRTKGFTISQAGNLGGALLIGGIVGAAIIPVLSDKLRKRKIFLLTGIALSIPGLLGVIFAGSYWLMAGSMFILGFFLMSLAPVGYQYAAEITHPAPEGTSNGLLNLAGQASVIFIYGMEAFKNKNGSFTPSLLILAGLLALCVILVLGLKESALICAKEQSESAQA
ncbi:MAG: MFS transporter [Actinobacteria bacterium]|nr:MFS transporter [Actinomycetota bacterium]